MSVNLPPGRAGRHERRKLLGRLNDLHAARELALRDLGGLVLELYRFGEKRDPLVRDKLEGLIRTHRELVEIEQRLDERRGTEPSAEAAEPGLHGPPASEAQASPPRARLLVLIGSPLVMAGLFFTWYSTRQRITPTSGGVLRAHSDWSAWQAFTLLDVSLASLAVAVVAIALLYWPGPGGDGAKAIVLVDAAATAAIVYRIVRAPGEVFAGVTVLVPIVEQSRSASLGPGAFTSLAGVILVLGGASWAALASRRTAPEHVVPGADRCEGRGVSGE